MQTRHYFYCEQDLVDQVAATASPLLCIRDDDMVSECVYLLNK